jgi:hypothetical protein
MYDLHFNHTLQVRELEELDIALGRLGMDSYEEAVVKQGLREPYSELDLSVMTTTTTTFVKKD